MSDVRQLSVSEFHKLLSNSGSELIDRTISTTNKVVHKFWVEDGDNSHKTESSSELESSDRDEDFFMVIWKMTSARGLFI